MARQRRSKGTSKHVHQEIHDDPVFQTKRVAKKKPVNWEEDDGDLQPIFAPKPMFIPEELEPYRSMPALFDHKKSLRKLVGPPFRFLDLPTELRVDIYRYCLVWHHTPIFLYHRYTGKYPTRLALSLLRTCRAMHNECAQILYGENRFFFQSRYDHLDLLRFLNHIGPSNRRWLQTLTMKPPSVDGGNPVHTGRSRLYSRTEHDSAHHHVAYYRHVCPELALEPTGYNVQKITWGGLCRSLVTLLMNLPRLRELVFLLPEYWEWSKKFDFPVSTTEALQQETEAVWFYLSELLRFKPFLNVHVVHLVLEDDLNSPAYPEQEQARNRFLEAMRRR